MVVMSWVLGICKGKKIGAYLSDISGAFDRVCKEYLLVKLHSFGVGHNYLNFLSAYLAPRRGQVVVQGSFSDEFEIANIFFKELSSGPLCGIHSFPMSLSLQGRGEGLRRCLLTT